MVNYEKYDFGGFTQASCKSDFTSLASAFWNDSRVANRPGTFGTVCVLDTPSAGPPAGGDVFLTPTTHLIYMFLFQSENKDHTC